MTHPKTNLLLSALTTLKIGGQAKYLLNVKSEQELTGALNFVQQQKIPWYVIGDGSNIVASDKGFKGLIIKIDIKKFDVEGPNVTVGAGNNLLDFIFRLNHLGLAGLEKMAGIPGTVAGAVYGNAGAYGQEIKDKITKVKILSQNNVRWISKSDCQFSYRESIFKKKKNWIIVQAAFNLQRSDPKELIKTSKDIIKLREQKYRPGLLCPGSFFKNIVLADLPLKARQSLIQKVPKDKIMYGKIPAGYLLEQVGAKGMQMGGIKVAEHHGNLFYNTGKGKASDIRKLAVLLKNKIEKEFGIELEEEIQYLGI